MGCQLRIQGESRVVSKSQVRGDMVKQDELALLIKVLPCVRAKKKV